MTECGLQCPFVPISSGVPDYSRLYEKRRKDRWEYLGISLKRNCFAIFFALERFFHFRKTFIIASMGGICLLFEAAMSNLQCSATKHECYESGKSLSGLHRETLSVLSGSATSGNQAFIIIIITINNKEFIYSWIFYA